MEVIFMIVYPFVYQRRFSHAAFGFNDENIVILAATEVEGEVSELVTPLIDEIENNRPLTFKKNLKEWVWYLESKLIWNINDKDDYFRHNNNGKNGKRVEQSWKSPTTRTIEKLDRAEDH